MLLGYAGDFTSRLVDTSAPSPASLRLLWICRTPRQLRSASRGYVERSASFAPQSVAKSTGRLRFTPLRSPFFNIQLVLRRMSDQELLQTLRILKPISRFEEFAPG